MTDNLLTGSQRRIVLRTLEEISKEKELNQGDSLLYNPKMALHACFVLA